MTSLADGDSAGGAIEWNGWEAATFEKAAAEDRPILLWMSARWCADCRAIEAEAFSDAAVARLVDERLVPLRADADRLPHVRDRYNAAGWPVVALLTQDGELMWSGAAPSARQLETVIGRVLDAWTDRRDEIRGEIERHVMSIRSARQRRTSSGLVRREAADDVMTAVQQSFDARNGGFGQPPRFLPPDLVETLFAMGERAGNPDWTGIAERTLDGVTAGELIDREAGGFFRLTRAADWTDPATEKLLEPNAWALRAFALGAHLRDRADWLETVERTIAWADETLGRADGLWNGSQAARAPGNGARPPVDPTVFTDACAQWIAALAEAGARHDREVWIERARSALDTLLERMAAPNGLLHHYQAEGEAPAVPGLVADVVEAGRACLVLAQATGDDAYVDRARALAEALEAHFWADDGGFEDLADGVERLGALRHSERPFESNSAVAAFLVDLATVTDGRAFRSLAERTLALLSPVAGRYGFAAGTFAMATEHFFEAPRSLVVVGEGERADGLRRQALRLPVADRNVLRRPDGGSFAGRRLAAVDPPAVYVCGTSRCSGALREAEPMLEALDAVS